jgi:glycosyltransferase involved in cell wall biosynthesis
MRERGLWMIEGTSRTPARARPPLRVLYVQPCCGYGGSERVASMLIPLLGEWDVDVLPFVGPDETICRWLARRGVPEAIVSMSIPPTTSAGADGIELLEAMRWLRGRGTVGAEIEEIVRERQIDLVYAATPPAWLWATEAARRANVPVVWGSGSRGLAPVGKAALRAWARLCPPDLLLCSSEPLKECLAGLVPAPSEVLKTGVELDRFRPTRGPQGEAFRAAGATATGPVIGFAGRLVPEERPTEFIDMAARIASAHPGTCFLIAGESDRRAAYEARAAACGLKGRLRFVGYVEDMPAFYSACDIVAVPARGPSCPAVVYEAMAMQRPVVVSQDVASAAHLHADREALVFSGAGDGAGLAAAVDRLVSSETLRASIARQGCERVRREHDVRMSARRLARALRMVAAMSGLRVMPEARRELLQSMNA